MNLTDYSDNLFAAIDLIVDKKLSEVSRDRTIKCKITKCPVEDLAEDAFQIYEVEYQGQKFNACLINSLYKSKMAKDKVVYVLIPLGDMRNDKFIIAPVLSK